jgi:hypothetical protein
VAECKGYLILLLLAQNEKWELIPNDQYVGPMEPLGMKHLSDSYEKSIPNNKSSKVSIVNQFFLTDLPSHQITYYHQCHP